MLIVHVSDLHLDYKRYGKVNPLTGINSAWESSYSCWMHSCKWAIENEADCFIFGGDGFANGRPSPEATEMMADGFRLLASARIPSVVIRGNHELISLPASHRDINYRFADIPFVTVVDTPRVLHMDSGLEIVCVPWPKRHQVLSDIPTEDLTPTEINHMVGQLTTDRIEEMSEEIGRGFPSLLAGHFTASGATLGTDRRGSEILVHAVFEEPVVSLESLIDGPWQHVALGHIHKNQKLASGIYYVGSPNRVDFSEENDRKGFHAIRYTENSGKWVADVEFVETPARIMRTIKVSDGIPEDLLKGTLVKLVLPDGQRVPTPSVMKEIAEAGALLVKVDARPITQKLTSDKVLAVEVSELDGLKSWMDRQDIDQDEQENILSAAQNLIDEEKLTSVELSQGT
jgi:exonuclease SbcD